MADEGNERTDETSDGKDTDAGRRNCTASGGQEKNWKKQITGM